MSWIPVALLMLLAALMQVTWAPGLSVYGAFPNLVLVLVTVITWTRGQRAGLIWACVGGLLLDYGRKLVEIAGRQYPHLTPKEFELLYYLACRTPNPVKRATIYREVWEVEPPSEGVLKTVEVHVRRVRLKLGWKSDQWLVSVSGRGYALISPAK